MSDPNNGDERTILKAMPLLVLRAYLWIIQRLRADPDRIQEVQDLIAYKRVMRWMTGGSDD